MKSITETYFFSCYLREHAGTCANKYLEEETQEGCLEAAPTALS